MRVWRGILLVLLVAATGCGGKSGADGASESLAAEKSAAIETSVREFMNQVAQDVTQNGPLTWQKEFQDSPSFFMASDGQLAFANGQAAQQGIPALPNIIKKIELRWNGVRVDVLAPDLAVVGASWQEVREDPQGHSLTQKGYFTGVVQQQNGRWQFRDAHWSTTPPEQPKTK
jgi:hypothetical protein